MWIAASLEGIWQDVVAGLRNLRRHPSFTITAVLTASLGIGAATAVFSVVDRILFRALPYPDEDRLVSVGMMTPMDSNEFMFPDGYFLLRRYPGPFEAMTSFQAGALACDLTEHNPLRLQCLRVESNFLDTLGVPLQLGRSFTSEEDRPNGPRVAIISHGVWQSRFAGDPGALGSTIDLDGGATTVVGVLPKNFAMPTLAHGDILLPIALNESTEQSGRAVRVFARLRRDVPLEQARGQLGPSFARVLQTVPPQFRKEVSLHVRALRDRQVGEFRTASIAFLRAVLAVLLIACLNVANLLLARAVARDRELATRAALGASRLRLARQALVECLLLGLLGGAVGSVLAFGLVRASVAFAPGGLPWIEDASIDLRVLLFTVAVSVGSGLIFGIAPSLRPPRRSALANRWVTSASRGPMRATLVAAQIAMSLALLTGAGLLLESLRRLEGVTLGMETSRVLTASFVLGRYRYDTDARQLTFFSELERRLDGLPGVQVAAISDSLPPTGATRARPFSAIAVEGRPPRPEGTGGMVAWRYITPGYFSALGISVLRGRLFTEQDRDLNTHSVVLSESLSRKLFPGEDSIGRRILKAPDGPWFTIIGVVADVRNGGPAIPADPEYYLVRKAVSDITFLNQNPGLSWRAATVIARTAIDPGAVAASLRSIFSSLDPTLPVDVATMDQRLHQIHRRPRFNALLLSAFAAVGLLLAATGLFGVLSFLVTQRTREVGVRVALGATPGHIMKLTLLSAARWTAAGLILGVAGSIAVTRLVRPLLFQVDPADPLVIASSLLLLCSVAFLAALGPTLRAVRLNPIETLRQD